MSTLTTKEQFDLELRNQILSRLYVEMLKNRNDVDNIVDEVITATNKLLAKV